MPLLPVLGLKPTQQAVEKYIADMRRNHASQSHVVNTSIALERYGQKYLEGIGPE